MLNTAFKRLDTLYLNLNLNLWRYYAIDWGVKGSDQCISLHLCSREKERREGEGERGSYVWRERGRERKGERRKMKFSPSFREKQSLKDF